MRNLIDYHVHTTFSDGILKPEELIEAGKNVNIEEICITDHYSHSKIALTKNDLSSYFNEILRLKKVNASSIKVFAGIEVDLYSVRDLNPITLYEWDLILFEYVFSLPNWEKKFKEVLKFKKDFPDYSVGLAHTRFSRLTEIKFNRVFEQIKENEIVIELNTSYQNYRDPWFRYLDDSFWYSIGSDAHSQVNLGDVGPALFFLEQQEISFDRIIQL
ncbi:MAG: PHP domain-containing protein [Candidatus Hodarchaeales archaeon]